MKNGFDTYLHIKVDKRLDFLKDNKGNPLEAERLILYGLLIALERQEIYVY